MPLQQHILAYILDLFHDSIQKYEIQKWGKKCSKKFTSEKTKNKSQSGVSKHFKNNFKKK